MERALLILAVSSLLILSSVEATEPVISPAKAPRSDLVAMMDSNLNMIKLNAEQAIQSFDNVSRDGTLKNEAQGTWLQQCVKEYTHVIYTVTEHARGDVQNGFVGLNIDLTAILMALDRCDRSTLDFAGGLEDPAKMYDTNIRDLTRDSMSIYEAFFST